MQTNLSKFMLVIAFLTSVSGSLSANTQKLISDRKVNPRDTTLAVRNIVSGGGAQDLLQGYSAYERGKNDFDGNKLTSDRNIVVDAITLNYGVASTGTGVESVNYTTALPPQLKSASLIIKQDEDVIRKISIAAINEAKNTDARWYELGGFALLKEDLRTEIIIDFAAAIDPGTGNAAYIEVIFRGFETAIKR